MTTSLQAQRHNHAVCRAQRARWPGHRPVPAAPPPYRVLKFLRKIDRGTSKDKTLHLIADNYATHKHPAVQLARQASAIPHALHAHLGIMAEYGRAVLSRHHNRATSPRRMHQRAGTGRRHQRIHCSPQHYSQAAHLDQERARHPTEDHSRQAPLESTQSGTLPRSPHLPAPVPRSGPSATSGRHRCPAQPSRPTSR